ncbi:hypothetical protein QP175_18940 [Sphingomonas aerolata]|uniref:hypothetical protein n=1 Tax=Sphingomonas aerolata TaxID=185951 RepID=UPI002FE0DA03
MTRSGGGGSRFSTGAGFGPSIGTSPPPPTNGDTSGDFTGVSADVPNATGVSAAAAAAAGTSALMSVVAATGTWTKATPGDQNGSVSAWAAASGKGLPPMTAGCRAVISAGATSATGPVSSSAASVPPKSPADSPPATRGAAVRARPGGEASAGRIMQSLE